MIGSKGGWGEVSTSEAAGKVQLPIVVIRSVVVNFLINECRRQFRTISGGRSIDV